MTYFERIPTGQLSKYIEKFWYCQADDLANTTLTIPLLHHELVFNFSDHYCIIRNLEPDNILESPRSRQPLTFAVKNDAFSLTLR